MSNGLLDPTALMAIRNLEWRAQTIVEGFWHGLHRSPYHGFSVEFTEYRPYVPGDDLRYLDWKLAARTDRHYLKKFEDETNLRAHVLLDASRSMSFASGKVSKLDYARTLAATLAWFLAQQGDATGLLIFDEKLREYLPARNRPGHLRRLMLALERQVDGKATDVSGPLRRIAELTRKRGLIIFISDLLVPLGDMENPLALLTASGHEVLIFQILDPRELRFDFAGAARFEDMETGGDLFVDPALARESYCRTLDAHLDAVKRLCERIGITRVLLETSRPLELALFDFLKHRSLHGKARVRRRQTA